MRNVRRYPTGGSPVFITQACRQHRPALAGIEALVLAVLAEVRAERSARVHAHVILPDHLHLILGAGEGFGGFMQALKLRIVRRAGRGRFWQDRFHDHILRDDGDWRRHLDYLHYNPVRHGWSAAPEAYPWTSYRRYAAKGWYEAGWGHSEPRNLAALTLEPTPPR